MKERLLTVLRPLVANKGLSKEEVEGLAAAFVGNLSETSTDDDVRNVANSANAIAELMQKSSSRQVSAVEQKYKDYVPKPKDDPKPDPEPKKPEPTAGLTAEQIQKMIADGIAAGLKPVNEAKEKERLQTLLFANEKVSKIPEFFRKGYSLDKEEDLDSVVLKMETDYAAAKQEMLKSGEFVAPPTPPQSQDVETDDLINRLHKMAEEGTK